MSIIYDNLPSAVRYMFESLDNYASGGAPDGVLADSEIAELDRLAPSGIDDGQKSVSLKQYLKDNGEHILDGSVPRAFPKRLEDYLAALGAGRRDADEKARYVEKYRYSPDRFASVDDYFLFLAKNLSTPEEINKFVRYLYEYQNDRNNGQQGQRLVNTNGYASGDNWKDPYLMATEHDENGNMFGDCEDLALFFEQIFRLQGKETFCFSVPGHTLVAYAEFVDGRYVAHVVDTTDPQQRACKTLTGRPGEPLKDLFSSLVNAFSRSSDAKSDFDPDTMGLNFIFRDGRAYSIPANFSLAERYGELRSYLLKGDHAAALKMIEEELKKAPGHIGLHIARLQFMVLCKATASEIDKAAAEIASLKVSSMEDLNQLAYFLSKNGFKDTAVRLFESAVKNYDGTGRLNYIDTLADLCVAAGQYDKARAIDTEIRSELERVRAMDNARDQTLELERLYGVFFMQLSNAEAMLSARAKNYPLGIQSIN